MKKLIVAAGLATATLLATAAGTAFAASSAAHIKSSFSGENLHPAGTLCDFALDDTFTVDVNFTAAPNGMTATDLTLYVTHTNQATGYSLTEVDHQSTVIRPDSSGAITAGIFWHLRDASGGNVLVKAGEASLDPATGNLISFTPNSGFGQTYAQIICPALGGSPA